MFPLQLQRFKLYLQLGEFVEHFCNAIYTSDFNIFCYFLFHFHSLISTNITVLVQLQLNGFITPSQIHQVDGVLCSIDFFVYIFLCFFVSKITRKRLDRFA